MQSKERFKNTYMSTTFQSVIIRFLYVNVYQSFVQLQFNEFFPTLHGEVKLIMWNEI